MDQPSVQVPTEHGWFGRILRLVDVFRIGELLKWHGLRNPQPSRHRGRLVFWSTTGGTTGGASGIHHVAIYLGNSQYVEAPRPGKNVRVSTFDWSDPNMYGRLR
ncbi:NlpC/P60 family protein [Streptomyces melanogenes]|uniref:NlpC/P60 family protein n=1 Tax=Streptomyces melanogenes TaxID=67326 RepID=A0ABZ1XSP0_9ACTN